jgi:mannitol operon transcriptional antiterminator
MVSIDVHSHDILALLLQADVPIPSHEIARQIEVTPRMVHYRLDQIEAWLDCKGARLIRKPRSGVFIDAPPRTKHDLQAALQQLSSAAIHLSQKERLYILLIKLLTTGEPVIVKRFGQILHVSRTTVFKDLDRAEDWLKDHRVQLLRRPNFGCQVAGYEGDLREATVHCLLESGGETHLLTTIADISALKRFSSCAETGQNEHLSTFIRQLEIRYVNDLIRAFDTSRLTDRDQLLLVLRLALVIERNRQGHTIEASFQIPEDLEELSTYKAAKLIAGNIAQRYNLTLSRQEVAFISHCLLKARIERPISDIVSQQRPDDDTSPEIMEFVDKLLLQASRYLHPSLRVDKALIQNLSSHLAYSLVPALGNSELLNPLLSDIKEEYPYIFNLVENCVHHDEQWSEVISENSIGYLTLHLAVAVERLRLSSKHQARALIVCNAGIATTMLLESRIRGELPEIQIAGRTSFLGLRDRAEFGDLDLIISTINLEVEDVPVVVVSPFLKSEDVIKIRTTLAMMPRAPRSAREGSRLSGDGRITLADLLTNKTLELKASAETWRDAIDRAGEPLLRTGAINPQYIDDMKEVVETYGPYMVMWPGVALLHALPGDGVHRLCMSLTTFREPVLFNHPKHDPVDIAIVIGTTDKQSHVLALYQLMELLENKEGLAFIRSASFKGHVLALIKRHSERKDGLDFI